MPPPLHLGPRRTSFANRVCVRFTVRNFPDFGSNFVGVVVVVVEVVVLMMMVVVVEQKTDNFRQSPIQLQSCICKHFEWERKEI